MIRPLLQYSTTYCTLLFQNQFFAPHNWNNEYLRDLYEWHPEVYGKKKSKSYQKKKMAPGQKMIQLQ
jgi:hypothetical protein